MADVKKVTQAKPKVGGAVSIAVLGTALPTDAVTALASGFKALGYVTTDGVTNSRSTETADVKAWGGDTVMSEQTSKTDTFKFAMLESLNEDVLKMAYGDANVSGTLAAGITVKENSALKDNHCFVIDMIMKDNVLKRLVIPNGSITSYDDITYKDDQPVSYGVTITALPDADGNTHYEYIKAADKGAAE